LAWTQGLPQHASGRLSSRRLLPIEPFQLIPGQLFPSLAMSRHVRCGSLRRQYARSADGSSGRTCTATCLPRWCQRSETQSSCYRSTPSRRERAVVQQLISVVVQFLQVHLQSFVRFLLEDVEHAFHGSIMTSRRVILRLNSLAVNWISASVLKTRSGRLWALMRCGFQGIRRRPHQAKKRVSIPALKGGLPRGTRRPMMVDSMINIPSVCSELPARNVM
jgi:hypothetical protein